MLIASPGFLDEDVNVAVSYQNRGVRDSRCPAAAAWMPADFSTLESLAVHSFVVSSAVYQSLAFRQCLYRLKTRRNIPTAFSASNFLNDAFREALCRRLALEIHEQATEKHIESMRHLYVDTLSWIVVDETETSVSLCDGHFLHFLTEAKFWFFDCHSPCPLHLGRI